MARLKWLVCILFVASCGGSLHADPAGSVLQATESGWVRNYALWQHELYRDTNDAETLRRAVLAGETSSRPRLRRVVVRLEGCARRYLRDVGLPPSERLREGALLALRACAGFARGERLELDALSGPPSDKLIEGGDAVAKGSEAFIEANKSLDAALVWNKHLPKTGGVTAQSRIEPLFSRVASTVAQRPLEIRCWSSRDWSNVLAEFRVWAPGRFDPAGFVPDFDLGRANLDPWTCRHLDALAYRHAHPRGGEAQLDLAYAVQILSHETQHLVSPGTEAETECYGMQALTRVARSLGASAAYARVLARRFWEDGYALNTPAYKTKLCRNGGPLDAHPASNVWP
jgi:hypothetical protein